ncbi:MAG: PaaI family thioesterase [Clostridia bacterium]|nr:PaaI family thioesterase [Clostridia bacterium]
MENENVNKMKEFFARDRFAEACGVVIEEVTDEYAVCSAEITDMTLNAGDKVQGGMIFTLADLTFSVLANHLHPVTVTQFASISYLNAAVGKKLYAKAVEISRSKRNAVYEVTVTNDEGLTVAIMQANGFIAG